MNKRGLSMIITTLILIVLVLVAVAIIWVVVDNILKSGTEGIALGKFTLDAGIKNVNIDNSSNNVSLTVKRNPGKGELSGIKFIFYDGANSEIITEEDMTLNELEERRFNFHLINLNVDNLIRISIVPIFKSESGKEIMGNIIDTYNVKDGVGCVANCTDRECGSDGCGGICGDCVVLYGDGWYCQSGTCIEGVNPCDLTSASWNETNVVEGTLVTLTVTGTDCAGIDLNYTIWEDDGWPNPDDFADSFIATGLGTTWITEWQDDTDGGQSNPPEYYFIARVVGETEEVTSSDPLLEVTQACIITCATAPGCRNSLTNGQIVSGECCGTGDCYDCETGYSWNGSSCIAACIPDCSCASITCIGETCSDGCGGTCAGTLAPDDCGVRICGPAPNGCGGSEYCGTCGVGESCVDGNCAVLTAYYVRSGATGSNDGSDWTNAWTSLPAILERGAVYYIADGTYGSYTFDDSESGTQYITIKKAIGSDHGTDTGWTSGYGDGVAEWIGNIVFTIRFTRGYYIFNGQVGGGPGNWKTGYGFKVTTTACTSDSKLIRFEPGIDVDYVTISHVEMEHCGMDVGTYRQDIVYLNCAGVFCNNLKFSYNYMHDVNRVHMLLNHVTDSILEYNLFEYRSTDGIEPHGEGISANFNSLDANNTIRYNIFKDIMGTGYIVIKDSVQGNYDIYGNLFYATDSKYLVSNGVITDTTGDSSTNIKVYNNHFISIPDLGGFSSPVSWGVSTSNEFINNICFDCDAPMGAETRNYNLYTSSTLASQEVNGQYWEGGGSLFIDFVNYDLHLAQATDAGLTLPLPYNVDMDGNIKGADGVWDRGAYEYVG